MGDHELTITVHDERRLGARRSDGIDVPDDDLHLDALHRETIEMFQRWLGEDKGKIRLRRDLEILGKHLHAVLFSGAVGSALEEMLAKVKRPEHLRLQLDFKENAAHVARYPWEFLYHPKREWFFSTGVDLLLSRYLPAQVPREEDLVNDDHTVRLLAVVAEPNGLDPVLEQPVLEAIEKVADDSPLELRSIHGATLDSLIDALQWRPHVVHFIGHGRYNDPLSRAEIALLDEGGDQNWIPEHVFAELFPGAGAIPRLVFLHLCESARGDPRLGFAGFAPRLVYQGVQAVVAMQFPITNFAAIAFSRAFYRELARGAPVDEAVQTGRWRITTSDASAYDSRVFGTPVLYMRSRNGIIRPLANTALSAGAAHQ